MVANTIRIMGIERVQGLILIKQYESCMAGHQKLEIL